MSAPDESAKTPRSASPAAAARSNVGTCTSVGSPLAPPGSCISDTRARFWWLGGARARLAGGCCCGSRIWTVRAPARSLPKLGGAIRAVGRIGRARSCNRPACRDPAAAIAKKPSACLRCVCSRGDLRGAKRTAARDTSLATRTCRGKLRSPGAAHGQPAEPPAYTPGCAGEVTIEDQLLCESASTQARWATSDHKASLAGYQLAGCRRRAPGVTEVVRGDDLLPSSARTTAAASAGLPQCATARALVLNATAAASQREDA